MVPAEAAKRAWRLSASAVALIACASCTYMKANPPADVDKDPAVAGIDNSCWMAAASNMLAGAGYGAGATLQERADDIYADMTAHWPVANSGWIDTALQWWLSSANNTSTTNPYQVVTVYGNKNPKAPWADPDGAEFIGNELRACHFVGLSISSPTADPNIDGVGGHAFTAWGDNAWAPPADYNDPLSDNPPNLRAADSDNDAGGDVQVYAYDDYTNPNPGGPNEGDGWYIDYYANHPFLKHITVLSPTVATTTGRENIVRVVGSYRLRQENETAATDLHYEVGTDATILSYLTRLDRDADDPPTITESAPVRTELDVEWRLSDNPVPQGEWVTITTEFILRAWNAMEYDNVRFTYPDGGLSPAPGVGWTVTTPEIVNAAQIPDVTGGYLVGAFDLVDPALPPGERLVGEYRLVHQYSYTQSPELHGFAITGEAGLVARNLRFGHSYGLPDTAALWRWTDWMSETPGPIALGDARATLQIDWTGRLPYPEGEDVRSLIPDVKNDPGFMPNR
ncbi:MAG: hypothetical protein V2I65_14170 [Paracoccaceae bacterium]|jgi:hypothetical protein|nr:hypothetical protein [Paracoccaceae bacterium]